MDQQAKNNSQATSNGNRLPQSLLSILVCPITRSNLIYDINNSELISISAGLAYPVRNGIPILIEEEARKLSENEMHSLR